MFSLKSRELSIEGFNKKILSYVTYYNPFQVKIICYVPFRFLIFGNILKRISWPTKNQVVWTNESIYLYWSIVASVFLKTLSKVFFQVLLFVLRFWDFKEIRHTCNLSYYIKAVQPWPWWIKFEGNQIIKRV